MSKEQNIEKEENFPKDPENITKNELHEHFDLDDDGRVTLEDYSEHIDYHCENPEVLEDKMEQAKYDRGFKYKKGGELFDKMYKAHSPSSPDDDTEEDFEIREKMERYLEKNNNKKDFAWGKMYADHKPSGESTEEEIEFFQKMGYFAGKRYAEGGETISGVRVPEMEYGEVSKTEDERREIIDKHRYAKSIGDTEMADEALEQYRMFCAVKGFKKGGLTSDKAKKMLEDGTAQGKKLTDKQKRYFGYIAGGGKGKYAEGGMTSLQVGNKQVKTITALEKEFGNVDWKKEEGGVIKIMKNNDFTTKELQDFADKKEYKLEVFDYGYKLTPKGHYKYAKGGFIKVGSDRDKAHQFLRKGGYYKKYYEEVQDLVEPGDGKNTESGMFVFDNKSDASDALYEMKMEGINIVDTDVKDYAEGGVVIHHNWDMFQRKYTGWNVLDFNDIQRVIHTFPTEEEAKRFVKRRGYKDRSNEITIFEKGGLFKGDFSFGGFTFKNAIVTKLGSGYGVRIFLKNPDWEKETVKEASKELIKVEKKFFGSKQPITTIGGYSTEGGQISSGDYSKQDATKFAKHLLTLNEGKFSKGGKTDSNDKYIEEFIDEDTGESVFIERSRKEQAKKAEDSKSYNKIKKRNQMKAVRLQSELFNISWEIKSLESDLNDIEQTIKENIFETEETAEPEGGPIANRLGAELEDLERRKIAIKKLISKKTQDTYDLEDRLDRLEYL